MVTMYEKEANILETEKDRKIGSVVLDLVRAANLLERLGGQYAKEVGLGSVQQYMILSMLKKQGTVSMSDLRQSTLVTKQAITGLIERMKKQGLIITKKDPQDGRRVIVEMTSLAEKKLEEIRPYRIEGNRQAFSKLEDDELEELQSTLTKLIAHLK